MKIKTYGNAMFVDHIDDKGCRVGFLKKGYPQDTPPFWYNPSISKTDFLGGFSQTPYVKKGYYPKFCKK